METLQRIQNLPATKNEVKDFVDSTVERIVSGELDPVELAPYLKAMEEIVKGIRDNVDVKNVMIGSIESRGKNIKFNSATISIVDQTRYDYSGDLLWSQFKDAEKKIAKKRKVREEILRSVTSEFPDPINDGIIFRPLPREKVQTIAVRLI